jgi:aminoacrylate peracid reductase
MPFETITPPNPPPPLAPYCSATRAGDTVYVSGILAIGADGATVGIGDVKGQTRHVIEQIAAILTAAGGTLSDIAFNHVFIADLADYAAMNEVYREYFGSRPPARYCIRAELVKPEFLVEISAVAHLGPTA